jgi:hypothetical protein
VAKPAALPSPAHNRVNTNASSVCSSQASNTSSQPDLELSFKKQLATNIQDAGGVTSVIINESKNQVLSLLCH